MFQHLLIIYILLAIFQCYSRLNIMWRL